MERDKKGMNKEEVDKKVVDEEKRQHRLSLAR